LAASLNLIHKEIKMKRILTSLGEWISLLFLAAIVVIAAIAFVKTCSTQAYGATTDILGKFQAPKDIKLTGVVLGGPMDTITSYLKYYWLEAIGENGSTVFVILYDAEFDRPVIGFINYAGPPDENQNYDVWALYYTWDDEGNIDELGTDRNVVDIYLARYKKHHEIVKHLMKRVSSIEYVLARMTSPFGEHYIAIPAHLATADLHEWKECWYNDEFQAIQYKGFAITGYLIMNAKIPVVRGLVIVGAGGTEYYTYERGKPAAVSMETFMTLIGFQHFMHGVEEDQL
jgi:hypothetical protein